MTGLPESLADALAGPWTAVLSDGDGFVYESIGHVDDGDYVNVSVVRRSAAPVDDRLPGSYDPRDVLYQHDTFDAPEDGAEIAERWAQAQAIADALNAPAGPVDEPAMVADLRAEVDRLHAALAERDTPPAGPADDAAVWVATLRAGVEMHQPTPDGSTTCGRSRRTGHTHTAGYAVERWGSKACPRCWPVTS